MLPVTPSDNAKPRFVVCCFWTIHGVNPTSERQPPVRFALRATDAPRYSMNTSQSLPPLLVVGAGWLPPESPERLHLPGVRVWGIARELVKAGHPVRLASFVYEGADVTELHMRDVRTEQNSNGEIAVRLQPRRTLQIPANEPAAELDRESREFGAAAVIGCLDMVNRHMGRMASELPMWCDHPGDPMAERQLLARAWDSDYLLADQWRTLAESLSRADRVSGFSRAQTGALAGEMAALGRLNQYTAHEELIHCIPPWHEPREKGDWLKQSDCLSPFSHLSGDPLVRERRAPKDAFIIAQTGGFNSWLDEETLFVALETAMRRDARIHFAATGGGIPGHNERTFNNFARLVAASEFRERFHLLGWIALSDVDRVLSEADVAILADRPGVEGWLGGRYRLVDWIAAGLPIVATLGCELAQELSALELISGVPQRDSAALAEAILDMAKDPTRTRERANHAREYFLREYDIHKVLRPLLDWARDPKPASDLAAWRAGARPNALWIGRKGETDQLDQLEKTGAELNRIRRKLKIMKGSRLVRAAIKLR